MGWGGSEVKVGTGDTSIGRSAGGRVVGVSDGDETRWERRKRGGETADNVSTQKRDGVLSGDFFNGMIGFLGVTLIRVGLLESLGEVVVLIWGGRVEMERSGVLSGEIGVDERIKSGL